MKTLELIQGSAEWHAHRAKSRNASDAPAVMGVSPYVSRSELIRRKALNITPEYDAATLARFQRGHDVEPALRALAERLTGEDLFPTVGVSDDGYLSASFDGVSMDETLIFEGKQQNAEKAAQIGQQKIPMEDFWQIVHQFAVCESAQRCIYVVGDGSDKSARMEIQRKDIAQDIPALLAGWRQFDEDVANYQHEAVATPAPVVEVQTLPAVSVQVNGAIQIASNLPAFGVALKDFIAQIDMKPETDEAFAHAEAAVKTLTKAQQALEAAKSAGLAQVATVDEMVRTVDGLAQLARSTRLSLEKMVKGRKDEIRGEIVTKARLTFLDYLAGQNKKLKGRVTLPVKEPDFAGAMKGKKTITSLRSAADDLMAKAKIEASQLADDYAKNLATIDELAPDHLHLFRDLSDLVTVNPEHLPGIVRGRVAEHEAKEKARLDAERERIRKEEEAKAQRDAEAKAEQERERIRAEEAAKLKAENQQAQIEHEASVGEKTKGADGLPLSTPRIYADEPTPAPKPLGRAAWPAARQPASPSLADMGKPRDAKRPTDAEIIAALCARFAADRRTVVEWLCAMDLSELETVG